MHEEPKKSSERQTVLVGTYRPENEPWIKSRHLYNLPLPSMGRVAFHDSVTRIVLIAEGFKPLAFEASYSETIDRASLKAMGYAIAEKENSHGENYALYTLGAKLSMTDVLSDPLADVFVASSRCPRVVIDAAFYSKPYPKTGGASMPYVFEKLKPYYKKWHGGATFDPVQMDFLTMMYPEKKFPALEPLEYVKDGIGTVPKSQKKVMPRQFRLGEFFCGPGGLACGALSARVEIPGFAITHAWSNDYDQATCNTYAENICPDARGTVVCHDVRTLDLNDKRLTPIDGFAFGFPCNDFSVVGEHKGFEGTYGPLYQYGVDVLKKFRPMWFVAENVGGLASANEGAAFKKILASMKDAGYRIYPHLYKFEDYGVPQSRHRIIIIGIRKDQKFIFNPPSPTLLAPRDNSAKAALEVPPIPKNAPNNDLTTQHPKVVERLKYIKPGENAFTAKLPIHLRLNVKGARISQIYKRLDPSKPAYTVTGSGGGGTHIYHYSEPRALTNRERARLQTFPDAYLFTGSKESVRKQIGMAVPPRGAQIIFEALLRTFAGIEYEHVECNITDEGVLK